MSQDSGGFEPYPHAESVWTYLEDRFGIPRETFAEHRLWWRSGSGKVLWLAHCAVTPADGVALEWLGLPLMRQELPRGFPTNAFLRRFGGAATRNCFDEDWDTALRLMYDHQIERAPLDDKGGPYIVRSPAGVLGRGWVRKGRLLVENPKGWAAQLLPRTELAEGPAPP